MLRHRAHGVHGSRVQPSSSAIRHSNLRKPLGAALPLQRAPLGACTRVLLHGQGAPCGRTRTVMWSTGNGSGGDAPNPSVALQRAEKVAGASTDLGVIYKRLSELALPYWSDPVVGASARWKLAGVVGLTLATTGVSVMFNFLGRDFFNALSEKNEAEFYSQLVKYLGAFAVGIPVFVFKSYYQSRLAVEWRAWMTERLMTDYFQDRTFYALQSQSTVDNPDQRISSDVAQFTNTTVTLSLVLLNASIDLISFSGILYSIYPPLFLALIAYSSSGTFISLAIGKNLVGLNFAQEAREADLRYGLVRVRENAESVAFYRGESDEQELLAARLRAAVENYLGLLVASRNLDFFTSFYRYLIQLLPAAVVAPLFFQGKIEFGVINQSQSAFNHVLNDLSLVVYQFESLAGFSAVVDRLGQFTEAMGTHKSDKAATAATAATAIAAATGTTTTAASSSGSAGSSSRAGAGSGASGAVAPAYASMPGIQLSWTEPKSDGALLSLHDLAVVTPDKANLLVQGVTLSIKQGQSLLIMGPSGAGKTSILRAVAGLWQAGAGEVGIHVPEAQVMFLPQKPYMVLGSLRDQVLYPRFDVDADSAAAAMVASESGMENGAAAAATSTITGTPSSASTSASSATPAPAATKDAAATKPPPPPDSEIVAVLRKVRLGHLLARYSKGGAARPAANGSSSDGEGSSSSGGGASDAPYAALSMVADWSASLSLGEQQRLAWARLLLSRPALALLDEATSALDQATEAELYAVLAASGITYVSVGHRPTLRPFHAQVLQLSPGPAGAGDSNGGRGAPMSWELLPSGDAAVKNVV
uniref:ABC transporter domain-containing protein n=1 Tax=Chlamydomonas leiostraca TaxID=1034604 RepID=A0A7S0RAI6_9CHLO|mmetsp:Transcript_17379/g.43668  ORF Transcript_17379/g.43668 Transcript_17379/m.43668 type:complete len:817 (+) Transcript_17379:104-2554(+)